MNANAEHLYMGRRHKGIHTYPGPALANWEYSEFVTSVSSARVAYAAAATASLSPTATNRVTPWKPRLRRELRPATQHLAN